MIAGDDPLDVLQAAPIQAGEVGATIGLGVGPGERDTKSMVPAVPGDAGDCPQRAIDRAAGLAHPLAAGVKKQVGRLVEPANSAPRCQPGIELLRGPTDLGRGKRNLWPQELYHDVAHLASRNRLDIHLGPGPAECLLGAQSVLEGERVEAVAACLR